MQSYVWKAGKGEACSVWGRARAQRATQSSAPLPPLVVPGTVLQHPEGRGVHLKITDLV